MPRIDGLEVHAEFQSVVKCLHKQVPDIPAMVGMGLIVLGVVVIHLFSKTIGIKL